MLKHKLLTLFVVLCATTALWASNTITYTATEKLTRSTLNVGATTFGPAIINHEFANGIGTITCNGEITTIGVGAFDGCSDLTSIAIPNSVTTIGNGAFYKCVGLNTITIPYSVTTIGTSAFAYCDRLPSIDVDTANTHYVSVDGVLFNYAKDTLIQYPIANPRSEYVIPDSVTTIGNRAFVHSSSLVSITIPQSVTTIEDMAFYYCDGLLSITIPKSVTTIGKSAFAWCDTLPFIDVDTANTHYVSIEGVLFNYTKDTLIQYPIANPRTAYTIPNSVTAISDRAFARCKNLTSLTCEVATPPTCGYNCFYEVDTSIPLYVPAGSVEAYLTADVWENFTNIRPIITDGTNVITYTATEKLTRPKLNIGETTFGPAIINHEFANGIGTITCNGEVTTIGNSAFAFCYGLTSITIPNSVTTIGIGVFCECYGLTSINVDAANIYYASIDGVLFNSAKDTLIQYPIGNLRTEYTIPNSVTTIEDCAFEYCSNLTSVTVPNSVTTIGEVAFALCSKLTFVTIGNSVTTIGVGAFSDCYGLTSITIPNSVMTIGSEAFGLCSGLTSLTCEATIPPTCGYNCFYEVDTSIPLYVPAGSVEAYQAADEWKDFTDIRPITAQEVETTEIESEPTESTVQIIWPEVEGADTYAIEIRLGDQLICSVIFNAQGQLVSINFNLAPGRGGHTYATTAESTAAGWAYTIAGLTPGTNYSYSVIAKDASEQVIDTKFGTFSTRSTPTNIDNVNLNTNATKSLRNGQVIIRQGNKTYNVVGQEL